jgi:hypothetical protein
MPSAGHIMKNLPFALLRFLRRKDILVLLPTTE